jgi:Flp pilus assembly protein TadD
MPVHPAQKERGNQMKKFTAMACLAAMTLTLTACGSKTKDVTIDTAALAKDLQSAITSDTLAQTATEMLPSIYFYDEDSVTSGIAYASSGATACEVAVIQSKDSSYTSEVEKLFQTRVDNQSSLYASYNEGEVTKLDNAIIESTGTYTVLCVCDDTDTAKDVLKEYGF